MPYIAGNHNTLLPWKERAIGIWGGRQPCQKKQTPTTIPKPITKTSIKANRSTRTLIRPNRPNRPNRRIHTIIQSYNPSNVNTRMVRSTNPGAIGQSATLPLKLSGTIKPNTTSQIPKAPGETKPTHKQIWDCNKTHRLGLFGTKSLKLCNTWEEPEILQATIYKYHREEKRIKLYLCVYFLTTNICKREFFATKYKTVSIHEEESHVTDCQRAIRNKRSPHNHLLVKRSRNTWETTSHNTFKCSWLEANSLKYFGYRITLHEAIVRSGDRLLHQDVTATECLIHNHHADQWKTRYNC